MQAVGGTGSYHWSTSDATIATVEESTGKVRSGELGVSTIRVEDVYNHRHSDTAKVGGPTPACHANVLGTRRRASGPPVRSVARGS